MEWKGERQREKPVIKLELYTKNNVDKSKKEKIEIIKALEGCFCNLEVEKA